ncbi:MAG: PIN domain-containing protein [Methyloglobulus sp.]|nr:PIN domain-containing protein [Methyloglobulus sp.]
MHLEGEAIKTIISLIESQSQWLLISSQILALEISKNGDVSRKKELNLINALVHAVIKIDANIAKRANEFERRGLQAFDALHLACAEGNADIFLTVDDKFLNKARTFQDINVKISNPLAWLNEVLL